MSSQPSAVRCATPIGAVTAGARKSPSPKASACARSGKNEPTWSAWLEASDAHQAVDGHPRASSMPIRANVGTSNA